MPLPPLTPSETTPPESANEATTPHRKSVGLGLVFAAAAATTFATPTNAHATPQQTHLPKAPQSLTGGTTSTSMAVIPTAHPARTYTVRPGDTVSAIALRYDSSVSSIVRANGLDSRAFIKVGQTLRIPSGSGASSSAATTTSLTYRVKKGETVSHIAARSGVSISSIISANGLNSKGFIKAGQVIRIPSGGSSTSTSTTSSSRPATYTVRRGDTVSAIAMTHGTSSRAIISANGLNSKGFIKAGQRLTIPNAKSSSGNLVASSFAGRTYPSTTVAAANQNKRILLNRQVPSKSAMRRMIVQTANSMGVPSSLALAVAKQESGFNMRAVSPANAIGVMQVIPSSGRWASQLVGRDLNLLNPRDNVIAGVAILRALLRTSASQDQAIASYYQGQASVRRNGMFSDTRRYVANVKTLRAQFS